MSQTRSIEAPDLGTSIGSEPVRPNQHGAVEKVPSAGPIGQGTIAALELGVVATRTMNRRPRMSVRDAESSRFSSAVVRRSLVLGILASSLIPKTASADASSWFYMGWGPTRLERANSETAVSWLTDFGMGTSPDAAVSVGGLGRLIWHFPDRPDLAMAARAATHGFVAGGWGAGVDLGGYQRWWGVNSTGFIGDVVLGAPWGVTLLVGASAGTNDHKSYFATLGIDLARLTVHGSADNAWFPNPFPSPR